jgi:hypothetical protein
MNCTKVRKFAMNSFKHAGHLIRVALVFVVGFVIFFVVRSVVVPRSFGQYGHYRGDFIKELAARPVVFAGRDACTACHEDNVNVKKAGKHANVACEACHGPLARHADDPSALVPKKPDTAVLCVQCHEANSAKPKGFPQVVSKDHAGDVACGSCHQPHNPKIG